MNKKIFILFYTIFFIVALSFFIFSDFGLIKRIELNSQKNQLLEISQKEQRIRDSLKIEKNRLENDYTEIERIAREYFGYISPNETVYIITKSK